MKKELALLLDAIRICSQDTEIQFGVEKYSMKLIKERGKDKQQKTRTTKSEKFQNT